MLRSFHSLLQSRNTRRDFVALLALITHAVVSDMIYPSNVFWEAEMLSLSKSRTIRQLSHELSDP